MEDPASPPQEDPSPIETRRLPGPLPYHRRLQKLLAREYPEIWRWFASDTFHRDMREEWRLELLKTTYRLSADDHPDLHDRVRKTLQAFAIDAPWTLYQSQNHDGLPNAALAYLPGEVQLIFYGPILERLDDDELDVLLGHEVAHYYFYELENHAFFTMTRVLQALASDDMADPAHLESARLASLHTEILADRGAFSATGNLDASVRLLVKLCTDAAKVNAASYLQQAAEIFDREEVETDGITHPEVFIRTRALELWSRYVDDPQTTEDELETPVAAMMDRDLRFEGLDLLGQEELRRRTFNLIRRLLHPLWMRTDAALAHARLFFERAPIFVGVDEPPAPPSAAHDEELARYFAYVLTDFVALTRELEDGAVAIAFARATELGIDELLADILHKELGITKTLLKRIRRETPSILATLGSGDAGDDGPSSEVAS